jgi:ribonucleoside-diphosphate reductase alpha chain
MDYIGKWMASRFLGWQERDALGIIRRDGSEPGEEPLMDTRWHVDATKPAGQQATAEPGPYEPEQLTLGGKASGEGASTFENQVDAPSCSDCGAIMVRNGACYKCMNCGATSGCS